MIVIGKLENLEEIHLKVIRGGSSVWLVSFVHLQWSQCLADTMVRIWGRRGAREKIVSNGSASHKLLMVVECENHQDDYLPRVEMPPNSFGCAWEGEHWLDWDL